MSVRPDKSLHDACSRGRLRKVREILEKGGDVVSMLESRLGFLGYTPLHEATCQGHDDVLRLLLIYGGNVNAKANGDYTPLHIAASMDYVKCIEVLLKNNADIRALDDFHKTPYQTAIQHRRKESAKCLKSAEIIRAAADSPQELRSLLSETSTKDITATCFDKALVEACHAGNFEAVCMLLVAGATNMRDCIGISIKKGHYRVVVLLLLCYAAYTENNPVLETLLDGSLECYQYLEEFVDKSLPMETVVGNIRASLKNSTEDYTKVAIQLPGKTVKPASVLKVLLLCHSCRRETRKVNWSRLSLSIIHESWFDTIKAWVQDFNLSNNKLTSLPERFIDLRLVVRLNLSGNKLKVIPEHIFTLVCLRDLNVSSNAITELPDITEWRPSLKSLNVSDNNLCLLPASISHSSLETLNLSRNNFTKVPRCVCEIISLKDLDLSDNREINYLPDEMGKLRNVTRLDLRNLDQITDPPERMRRNAEDLVATLRMRLRSCVPYYTMKLMLVGKGCQGKTTLVHRLREDFTYKENDLTQGVEITDLSIKRGAFYKEFNFKVWDFGGQEDYYTTHQCFLSTMSLYLLVWRLIDGEEGVDGLTPWLDNIAVRSPGSTVIVVGTHLDCISPEKNGHQYVDHLKNMVLQLVRKPRYKDKILVPEEGICAVSCAVGDPKRRAEISNLRQVIYDTAANLKKGRFYVMGELIPASFFSLIDRIEKRKTEMQSKNQPPIIRKEEFHAMVKENSQQCRRDIQDPFDAHDATVFLRERGIVMHFDDPNEGLSDLYFIDPRWLCALMARVVTVKSHADLVKEGILEIQKSRVLFRDDDFPFDFYAQYIRLLVRFQIAYPLDEWRILVPSKLPETEPKEVKNLLLPFAPVRRVYKIDHQRIHGFWTRFMSRFFFYMKEMIAVDPTRYQKSKYSEHGFSANFCRSCVRVEVGSRTFPCFVDDTTWKANETVEKEAKKSDADSEKGSTEKRSPTSPKVNGGSRINHSSVKAKQPKTMPQQVDLQAMFLDPTVKLFSPEELAAGDDDVDAGIMINNVNTAMNSKYRSDSFANKKKESVKKNAKNLRIPSYDSSLQRRKKKSKGTSSRSSKKSTVEHADEIPSTNDDKNPASNEQHTTTDKTDSADDKSPSEDNEKSREIPTEETSGVLDRDERDLNESKESGENMVPNPPFHKMSVASSASFDSEQNDGYLSGSEQPSSRTNSEYSSSFRSPTDNYAESELFPESGNVKTANIYRNSCSYNNNRLSESVSTTGSVTSEDQTDADGEAFIQSDFSLSQSIDSSDATSMPTDTRGNREEWHDAVSSVDETNAETSPGTVDLENEHDLCEDSGEGNFVRNSDMAVTADPNQFDVSSQHASSQIFPDPGTSDENPSTNAAVADTKPEITTSNTDRNLVDALTDSTDGNPETAEPNYEITDAEVDVIGTNSGVTDTQPEIADTQLDVSDSKNDGYDINYGVTGASDDVTDASDDVTDASNDATGTKSDVLGTSFGSESKLTHAVSAAIIKGSFDFQSTKTSEHSDTAYSDSCSSSVASHASACGNHSDVAYHRPVSSGPYDNTSHTSVEDTTSRRSEPEDVDPETRSQATDFELEKCTLCKEEVPVGELVTIPLDVAELIEKKFLRCWRSGICLNHPELFLVVSHRSLPDTVIVESAVSPSPLGRRLLTFVVDHLDTLIKEWYPGLLISYGAEPTVQKVIPCRVCEKNGNPRPHRFTFDSCVTQYSMGNFVKCPRHEVSIQDIAPDVVLQDIDSNLLLDEEEIEYEKTDANKIGDGGFGKVYRGRCRGRDAAIKEYSTPYGDEDAMKRYCEVRKELNVLRRVGQHPFLVNLIGVCLRPFRLVLELAMEGSLAKTLFNSDFLIERVVIYRMIYQVADALSFLHSLNVIYRDLKPGNILVMSYEEQDDVNIKLTDFGTATFQFSEGLLALEGTPGYHAPEMLEEFSKKTGYDEKVDVFSLAMLIYGFITRRQPFYSIRSSAEINHVISTGKKPEYDDVMAARIGLVSLTWLMEKCLYYEPYMRPNSSVVAAQLRSPPFQIFLGVIALPCPQSVRHACVVEATRELWVAVDDKATNMVLIYELKQMRLKKKFTVNRIRPEDPVLCMQVNCMHVSATDVLIGLRGDLDVVTVHNMETYELKARIILPEPVFCMSSNDRYIFLGMSNGVFRVVSRTGGNESKLVEVSHSEPISCIVVVDKFLWLTVGKCIQIFHTEEDESMQAFELNAVRFSSSTSSFSHVVLSMDKAAVWCVSKGCSVVTGWDVNERRKICEIDCKSALSQVLSEGDPLSPVQSIITCVLSALDTVWVGTGGGMLLVFHAQSGELITWIQLFDDHVRALTLVSGPGPCSTEKCYVVTSGKNVLEGALSRGGKVVCRLGDDVIKGAPGVPSPKKVVDKKDKSRKKSFARTKSPVSDSQKSDVEDGGLGSPASGSLLVLFEALPAEVLRRIEIKS